jgi:site-specific DNA recombinase
VIGKRAANPSDYTLTGRIRCPDCGRGFIGTAADGRYQRYRYYTCWSRVRYGTDAGCGMYRFNANEVEAAVGRALIDLYTNQADLIDEARAESAQDHASASTGIRDQLAAVERELRDNRSAVDRYLTAFERGSLDDEDDEIRTRLAALRTQRKHLAGRKAELEAELQQPVDRISPADLDIVRSQIHDALITGTTNVRKALFEELIEEISVDSNDTLTPIFRLPALTSDGEEAGETENHRPEPVVRALTTMVGDTGIEPVTSSVSGKRSPAELIALDRSRWRRDLNPCTRLCRPLPRLSATPPEDGLSASERTTGFEPATLTLAR